uniref:Uncharacterized protein n=1 Tax=viral metagenome TaxID=1070528 RepID=A0A6M3KXR4_9ZZZZ
MEINKEEARRRVRLFFDILEALKEDSRIQEARKEKERRERSLIFNLSKFFKLLFKTSCHRVF